LDQARIKGLFDELGNVDRIETLLSLPPSDFSGSRSLFYFTPDYKVAVHYAGYAKRRGNAESVVIVSFKIPNSAIESLTAPDIQRIYWPNDEWKELIWRSCTNAQLPRHLRKYRNALLVIGTISKKPNSAYYAMASWQDVTEECLLRLPTTTNVQYVISGEEEGREFLLEHGARDLKVQPFIRSEFERLLAIDFFCG